MKSGWLVMLLGLTLARVEGVVSPLDKVTQELKEMKETMNSVQASLITSVSLIQGGKYRFSPFSLNIHSRKI